MRKSVIALSIVLALIAAACGSAATPMAVVNGQDVFLDDLVALDPTYEEVGRFEEAALIDDLGLYVLLTAIETSARDQYGVDVTDEEVTALFDSPPPDQVERVANYEELVNSGQVTEGQARADAKSFLVRREVGEKLAVDAAAMQELWDQTPQVFATACLRHIFTTVEEDAVAASDRVAAGEDFATVADEVSLDTASAGGLFANPDTGDCTVPLSRFVPEFGFAAATTPIGEVTGPFASEAGWHIILVEERTAPDSLAEVLADSEEYLTDEIRSSLVNTWLNDAIENAVVVVDPAIGTWSEVGNAIVPAEADNG